MAAVAGSINAAGFLAVGYYSANMTGNVSTLTTALHAGKIAVALSCGGLVLAFVSGAMLATVLVNMGRRRAQRSVYAWSILSEAIMLAVLGGFALAAPMEMAEPVLAYGLSFLMGLQNATVTRISAARVRTTHMTGMLTDVGIEFADWLEGLFFRQDEEKARVNREKLFLHGGIVIAFMMGGIGGAFAYSNEGGYFFLVLASVLSAIAAPGLRRSAEP
nr:YoaK family protein [Acetobacter conturbans]